MGVTAGAVIVGSTILQHRQQRKAARAERSRIAAQQKIEQANRQRAARNQVREARQQRAKAQAEAVALQGQGTVATPSSSVFGATGSIGSQLGYNLSFLDTTGALSDQASAFASEAVGRRSKAATFEAISSAASVFR